MIPRGRQLTSLAAILVLGLLLQACSSAPPSRPAPIEEMGEPISPGRDSAPRQLRDLSHLPDAVPRHEPQTRAGNPPTYVVNGKRYHLLESNNGYVDQGYASWYGQKFHGRSTSNGEIYDMYAMTAAHKTLRIPTYVQVTNLQNGRQVVVRVNDRGPFHDDRIIDLSFAAASRLGFVGEGVARVEVRALDPDKPMPVQTATASPPPRPVANGSAPTPAPGQALYLQLGSFISQDNAETLRATLAMSNVDRVQVQHLTVDRQQIYRVRVGPLHSPEEADRLALRINNLGMGVPTIVVD